MAESDIFTLFERMKAKVKQAKKEDGNVNREGKVAAVDVEHVPTVEEPVVTKGNDRTSEGPGIEQDDHTTIDDPLPQ